MERGSLLVSVIITSVESSSRTKTLIVSFSISSSELIGLLECTILIFTVASVDLTELSGHISLKTPCYH